MKLYKKVNYKVIGILLIVLGVMLISIYYVSNILIEKQSKIEIKEYYSTYVNKDIDKETNKEITKDIPVLKADDVEEKYIATLKIDKINLEKGLYSKNSSKNNVKYNIEILKTSDYPDVSNGNFILAAHSGNGRNAYFKKLDRMTINDLITVNYLGKEYIYKIVKIYDVEKTGVINISRNKFKDTLTLITCRQKTNNQIVIICEKI